MQKHGSCNLSRHPRLRSERGATRGMYVPFLYDVDGVRYEVKESDMSVDNEGELQCSAVQFEREVSGTMFMKAAMDRVLG